MTIIIIIDRNWNRLGNRITGQNAGFVSSSSSSPPLVLCRRRLVVLTVQCTKVNLVYYGYVAAQHHHQFNDSLSFVRSFIHKTISLTLESSEIRTLVHLSSQVGGWLMTMMMMIVLWGELNWVESLGVLLRLLFLTLPAALLLLYKESFCSLHQQQQTTTIHHRHSLRRYRYWWWYAYQVLCLVLSLKFKSTHLSHRCRRRYGNIRHVPIDPFIAKGGGGGLNMFFG